MKTFEQFEENDPYGEEYWEEDWNDPSKILDNFKNNLLKRGWKYDGETKRSYIFAPPSGLGFPEEPPENEPDWWKDLWKPYRLYVPRLVDKNDFVESLRNIIYIVAGIYGENYGNFLK